MRAACVAMLLTITPSACRAAERAPDVVVYFHCGSLGPEIVGRAEQQASSMFAGVGVRVAWRLGSPKPYSNAEVVEAVLEERAPEGFMPGALASASLGVDSGTRIQIFYDRVKASGPPEVVPAILAHVLVHEVTHILEGVNRHSGYGMMKARWEQNDFWSMRKQLPFAPEDIALIHAWAMRHATSRPTRLALDGRSAFLSLLAVEARRVYDSD